MNRINNVWEKLCDENLLLTAIFNAAKARRNIAM